MVEERLRDDAENGKLSIPLPNPSETSSLKMMNSGTYRKRQMPIRSTSDMFILSSKLNQKVVWIALSEDDQQLRKNPTIPPGQNMDEDRPKYGTNPYPVHVRVNIFNTFTLRHITSLL